MAVFPIITLGHPNLRKVAAPVEKFDDDLKELVHNMIETMRVHEGIGLAATQVNIHKRFFVVDLELIDEKLSAQAYVNPEILDSSGSGDFEEGCLSIPGVRAEVRRPTNIKVRYKNIEGETEEKEMDGLLARVFQHELDHLNGILFIDRIPPLKRKLLKPKLLELEGVYTRH